MTVIKVNILLLICICFTKVFGFYGFQKVGREILGKINSTIAKSLVLERNIRQPYDHFNKTDKQTWSMRYFESYEFWKPGGPIYLFVYGEAEADPGLLQTGIMNELAKETSGALYLSEHRYYGKSRPFSTSDTKNLEFLSSLQALADNAELLREIKSNPLFKKSKVVVVGGSYAGNLAAWLRLKYSDLVDAAIASSAPVFAKIDFYEYLVVVAEDIKKYGTTGCYEKIEEKFNNYDKLFQTSNGIQQLQKEFNICNSTDLNQTDNKAIFFVHRVSQYMSVAQYGTPQKIKEFCENNSTARVGLTRHKSLCRKSKIPSELAFFKANMNCYELTMDSYVSALKNDPDVIAWTYQTCTEFGYYQTTTADNQPFSKNIPLQFYYNVCSSLYGADFDAKRIQEGVNKSNSMYGGLKPNVTKVVFVNGDLDPWHRLGVLNDLSKDAPAFLIHETSHTIDLFSNQEGDPVMLKDTRKKVKNLIKKWIGADNIDQKRWKRSN